MRKILIRTFVVLLSLYIVFCGFFYVFQEKFIFHPQTLAKDYRFTFPQEFEEVNIKVDTDVVLNGLLFKSSEAKGLIIYLHGNAGALNTWGALAPFYTELEYDILFFDYRGFGKSGGRINSQSQLYGDVQAVYNAMKARYDESRITIIGYSIGTGLASYLAFQNNPKRLVLIAPYYSLSDLIQSICPVIPDFLIKYKLETYKYLQNCEMPVTIFHAKNDEVIDYENSVKLNKLLKEKNTLIPIDGAGHNNINVDDSYKEKIAGILSE